MVGFGDSDGFHTVLTYKLHVQSFTGTVVSLWICWNKFDFSFGWLWIATEQTGFHYASRNVHSWCHVKCRGIASIVIMWYFGQWYYGFCESGIVVSTKLLWLSPNTNYYYCYWCFCYYSFQVSGILAGNLWGLLEWCFTDQVPFLPCTKRWRHVHVWYGTLIYNLVYKWWNVNGYWFVGICCPCVTFYFTTGSRRFAQ